jgi:hypothetical protein
MTTPDDVPWFVPPTFEEAIAKRAAARMYRVSLEDASDFLLGAVAAQVKGIALVLKYAGPMSPWLETQDGEAWSPTTKTHQLALLTGKAVGHGMDRSYESSRAALIQMIADNPSTAEVAVHSSLIGWEVKRKAMSP